MTVHITEEISPGNQPEGQKGARAHVSGIKHGDDTRVIDTPKELGLMRE